MPRYLLTVETTERLGADLKVTPPVSVKELIERDPDFPLPLTGDALRLRLPDGRAVGGTVASFGVEAIERDGRLYAPGDPSDAALTLTIGARDVDDLPAGTEIWLDDPPDRDPA